MPPKRVNLCGTRPLRKLLEQVSDIPRTKHYSYRTEQAYLNWMHCHLLFHNKRHLQLPHTPYLPQIVRQNSIANL